MYVPQYNSAAGTAFLITLILLLLIICKASLRQSSIFLKVEIVICVILTIFYVVGSIDIIRACWYWLFDNFRLGPFIGSLIASVCTPFITIYNYTINSCYSCALFYFNFPFLSNDTDLQYISYLDLRLWRHTQVSWSWNRLNIKRLIILPCCFFRSIIARCVWGEMT